MKRTSVVIPAELATRLESEHRRRDVSAASIIREAVEHYLCDVQNDAFGFIGMVSSGGGGFQAKDDEGDLAAHWADDIAADRGDIPTPQPTTPTDEDASSSDA